VLIKSSPIGELFYPIMKIAILTGGYYPLLQAKVVTVDGEDAVPYIKHSERRCGVPTPRGS
jgi:hypothetical protein